MELLDSITVQDLHTLKGAIAGLTVIVLLGVLTVPEVFGLAVGPQAAPGAGVLTYFALASILLVGWVCCTVVLVSTVVVADSLVTVDWFEMALTGVALLAVVGFGVGFSFQLQGRSTGWHGLLWLGSFIVFTLTVLVQFLMEVTRSVAIQLR